MWSAALLLSKEPPASPNHTAGTPPGHVIKARFNMPTPPTPPPPPPTPPMLGPSCAINTNIKRNLLLPFPQLAAFFCVRVYFLFFYLPLVGAAAPPTHLPSPHPPTPTLNDKCSPDRRSVQIESRINEGEGAAQTVGRAPPPPGTSCCERSCGCPPFLPPTHTHAHIHYHGVTCRSSHWLPASF